jgi:outer membrane protein assembly factor BamB
MTVSRESWRRVATVAAVFSFVVLAVMLAAFLGTSSEHPFDDPAWRALKLEMAARPTDQQLAERARSLDLELRRAYFDRRSRIRTGGTLLLTGLVVFLVATKRANRRSFPEPAEPAPPMPGEVRDRRAARRGRAVSVTGGLLAAGAALLWITTPTVPPAGASDGPAPAAADEAPTAEELAAQWPSFRGHDGSGVASGDGHPTKWDGEKGEGILWKTSLPLPGTNSPVVWKDRVYLTGADAKQETVLAIDAASGEVVWKKSLVVIGSRAETEKPMEDTGYAAPTAATDGRRVYAMFASGRIAAFDPDGTQLWLRSFGPFENTYGHSSSLALFEDLVILQLDQGYADEPKAKLLALDGKTGKTVWEQAREVDTSWASPIVWRTSAGPQIVLSATPRVTAHDPKTGEEIWRAEVMYGEVGPTPIGRDDTVYVMQEDVGIYAIHATGRGDVSETHVLWNVPGGAADVTSPVTDGKRVWMVTTSGTLTCMKAETGEVLYEQDLEAEYYSSPSISGETLYLTSRKGVTTTVRIGDAFEKTGTCPLGETVVASFAFAPGRIYVRGEKHLYAIGTK